MTGCSTTTYTDPDNFRVGVPGVTMDLALTSHEPFKAKITWLKMRRLTLAVIDELTPRTAFLTLAPARTFFSFPMRGSMVWNGVRLKRGDFMMHGSGGTLHQLAAGATRWGLLSIAVKDLAAHQRTLLGASVVPPKGTQFVRSSGRDVLRLHTQACRLAATKPDVMAHREATRGLEHELLYALVNAIPEGHPKTPSATTARRIAPCSANRRRHR